MLKVQSQKLRILLAAGTLCLAAGCGGNDSSADNADNADNAGTDNDGSTTVDGNQANGCVEQALFPARPLDDNDIIRHIVIDETTGDIYFSTYEQLYLIESGSDEPVELVDRPSSSLTLDGEFWLLDDRLVFPARSSIASINGEGTVDVLLAMDSGGGEAEVLVAETVEREVVGGPSYSVLGATIMGDDVLWASTYKVPDVTRTGTFREETYYLKRTSFRTPGKPDELYESSSQLDNALTVNNTIYVDEVDGEWPNTVQRIVDLESGALDSLTAEEKFGGRVVAGDEESLLISRGKLLEPDAGVFRIAPDGSETERIRETPDLRVLGISTLNLTGRDGLWAFTDHDVENDAFVVYTYSVSEGLSRLGCADSNNTTDHAIAIRDGEVLVSIHRDESATILRYELQ